MPIENGNNRDDKGRFVEGNNASEGHGRPKGSFSIPDILRRVGEEEVPEKLHAEVEKLFSGIEGEIKDMKMMEGLMRLVFMYAVQGKSWAVQFIADRLEGRPKEFIEQRVMKDELIVE